MSNMAWIVGLQGLLGCFHSYLLFPINTLEDAQAATAYRDVKMWQVAAKAV